jgi:hypothetical protein
MCGVNSVYHLLLCPCATCWGVCSRNIQHLHCPPVGATTVTCSPVLQAGCVMYSMPHLLEVLVLMQTSCGC